MTPIEQMESRELLSASGVRSGTLDQAFGNQGVVIQPLGSVSGQSVAVLPDGKVLVGATANSAGVESFYVTRFNSDGTVDTSFGGSGVATVNVDGSGDVLAGIALQADGKIVLAGNDDTTTASAGSHILLARLNADGSLDTSFGTGGKVVAARLAVSERASAVAIAPGGSIVVAGAGTDGQPESSSSDILIDRFNADGSADAAFADGGELLTQAPGSTSSNATGLAIQNDGKLVLSAAGQSGIVGSRSAGSFVLRYNADGSADNTFAANAQPIAKLNGDPGQVTVEANGTILVAGSVATKKNGSAFAVVDLSSDGTLDRKFGQRGLATTNFGTYRQSSHHESFGADAKAYGVAVESDGTILISGSVDTTDQRAAITAYRPNGKPLQKFGKKGKAYVSASSLSGLPAITLSPSGAPVVAVNGPGEVVLARFTPPV